MSRIVNIEKRLSKAESQLMKTIDVNVKFKDCHIEAKTMDLLEAVKLMAKGEAESISAILDPRDKKRRLSDTVREIEEYVNGGNQS